MSKNMWRLNFRDDVFDAPENIVQEQCDFLRETTSGRVIAKIASYSGPIKNYIREGLLSVALTSSFGDQKVNIQEDLGDIGNTSSMYFAYEFFITSPSTPNYKFRVMFFAYTASRYPLRIVLDDDIASDIGKKQEIVCNSEAVFKRNLEEIINSQKVSEVAGMLNSIAINEEKRNAYSKDIGV